MQVYTNTNSSFPDQVVPDVVKASEEYGLKVGRAIEGEWFWAGRNRDRFNQNYWDYHRLRLYARGEQSVQKYKDELAINGDLSYLNLDWKPVPVIPKFVDIVVNGMSQRNFQIKAFATDPFSIKQRTKYAADLLRDVRDLELAKELEAELGVSIISDPVKEYGLETEEEAKLHLQLDYKQSIEIAEEELIKDVLERNKYEQTRKRVAEDLMVLGIGAVKTNWNKAEGIRVEYVDPANLVYSYTEDPNFEDIWYVGEVKGINLADLKKQFPDLTDSQLEEIQKYPGNQDYTRNWNGRKDENTIQVLYFEYKTYSDQVWKIKQTFTGLEKALEKPDTFNPDPNDNFERVSRSIETLYSGAKILGHPMMLKWEMAENITRPYANTNKVNLNYTICAPSIYKGRIESLVSRITGFADMIQLTHLKLQQVMSRMVPDGVFLDMDGLAEVDLGNGTNYNPAEALNMYFQTGSIVGRSLTQDGDPNRGKIPIQELQTSASQAKIASLIQTYQYYLQMIRDVTGLNEARDGSNPDRHALVGLQKLAAANSNVATRHLLQAMMYLTIRACENISLRVNDSLMFPLTRQTLENSISRFNVGTLEELVDFSIHEFGIFLELEPDEEEKQMLEQNIQIALKTQSITLSDAIDLRNINNLKLANQMLKQRQAKREKQKQEQQQQMIQAQAQANSKQAQEAIQAEMQKQQALAETTVQVEQAKSQLELSRIQQQGEIDKQLLQMRYQYDMQLKQMEVQAKQQKENMIEDRKDQRTKLEGSQQSQMISQRQTNGGAIDFMNPFNGLEQQSL
tara:strand:+ start:28466 stop:30853 length:2388 start_codon:yes stop_codon:yes gene_type:complete